MLKLTQMAYAVVAYVIFLGSFLYAIGFVGDVGVPKTIDSGPTIPVPAALAIDVALLGLFALQHSVMARPAFKRWWTRFVPEGAERSTYVLFSSLALILLFREWRPAPAPMWTLSGPSAAAASALFVLGWVIVLASTFMLSHFQLFGLSQAWADLQNRTVRSIPFRTPLLYGLVRHPIMLGFVIAFWSAPVMSLGHLIFAIATTGYILIALQLEEADLIAAFGADYRDYRRRTPMLVPLPRFRRAAESRPSSPRSP